MRIGNTAFGLPARSRLGGAGWREPLETRRAKAVIARHDADAEARSKASRQSAGIRLLCQTGLERRFYVRVE